MAANRRCEALPTCGRIAEYDVTTPTGLLRADMCRVHAIAYDQQFAELGPALVTKFVRLTPSHLQARSRASDMRAMLPNQAPSIAYKFWSAS